MMEKRILCAAVLGHPPTRRQLIGAGAMTLGVLATALHGADAGKSTSLHQEVDFKTSPKRIYEALLDAKQFGAFTGFPAEIDGVEGGAIKCFGGQIVGRNIELIPNRRIVQAWRETSWLAGVYSLVKFELREEGSGTRLILDHSGIAEEDREHLDSGWPKMYWEPLRKYLEK